MLQNYLTIAIRSFIRYKIYSIINILGLAIGLACSILIFLWVFDEASFDSFHKNKNQIFRIISDLGNQQTAYITGVTPAHLASDLQQDNPEILNAVRLKTFNPFLFKANNKVSIEGGSCLSDPSLFKIFDFEFVYGNADSIEQHPYFIVLNESLAIKYFGDLNPVGEQITIGNFGDFYVSAVIKDIKHSHISANYFLPFELFKELGYNLDSTSIYTFNTYIQVVENTNITEFERKLSVYMNKYKKSEIFHSIISLQPLKDIYLHSDLHYDFIKQGNINNLYLFTGIGILILLLANINFMTLTTAFSIKRAKEISIRKLTGAYRIQIIGQFFGETVLISFISMFLAYGIVEIILPAFNELTGKDIDISFLTDVNKLLVVFILVILMGLFAAIYPAIYVSGFNITKILRGDSIKKNQSILIRKILVITQFIITIILLVTTIVSSQQLEFLLKKDLGYNKESLITIPLNGKLEGNYKEFKSAITKNPSILGVTGLLRPLTYEGASGMGKAQSDSIENTAHRIHYNIVDEQFIQTMQITMLAGTVFSSDTSVKSENDIIINETAAKYFNLKNPVGEKILMHDTLRIIGVCKDFHFDKIKNKIAPLILVNAPEQITLMVVRIKPADFNYTIKYIEAQWQLIDEFYPFTYERFDHTLEKLYTSEIHISQLMKYFTILALVISCVGLYGLVSFVVNQNIYEIAIRKTQGADVTSLIISYMLKFSKWIIIAIIIGFPIAYFVSNYFIDNYEYRTEISIWVFLFAGILVLSFSWITMFYHLYKISVANPSDVLKHE